MNNRVWIFDTTLRDGEQSPGCSMNVPEKLRMAGKLVELGVDILEAGFPIASQGDFEAVDAVSREFPWVQVAALARCTRLDVERAAESLEKARRPRIHTFIATSDIHLKYKLKKSRQQVLDDAVRRRRTGPLLRRRRRVFRRRRRPHRSRIISNRFRAPSSRPARAPSISPIPSAIPHRTNMREIIGRIVKALGDTAIVSVHCHDDLGLAVANSLAAVKAGARQIECTINGIGERAGNCSLEEIVMVMKTRHDRYPYTPASTPNIFSPPARCSAR